MSKQSKIGVIGEGRFSQRANTTRYQVPIHSGAINTDRSHHQPVTQSDFNTNASFELFDRNKLHKPIPRHSPCCSFSPTRCFSPTNDFNNTPFGCPDNGKPKKNQDFKQFLSKFQNPDAVRRSETESGEVRENKVELFGDKFEDCSMNVQMFFIKYASTKSNDAQL